MESEGSVKRTYEGLERGSLGILQFDTTKNQYLVAGDDFLVKFWDMNNAQLLMSVTADGGLPANPRVRFNKDGTLLAVSADGNGIKVLADSEGLRLLDKSEDYSRASEAWTKVSRRKRTR